MTNANDGDRLSRVERILESLAERQERFQLEIEETKALVRETAAIANSNARSVQAWESRINDVEEEAEEERSEIKVRVNRIEAGIDTLNAATAELQQSNRENIAQHMEFRERFDRVLAEIEELRRRAG